jgi:hypothetical protein
VSQRPADAQTAEESQVKASYLFNFAKYVEWPSDASRGVGDPTVICVVGDERTASVLDQVTVGRKANGRRIEVKRPRSMSEFKACHILFIGFPDKARIAGILRALPKSEALIVGQSDQFMALGGMINLAEKNETIELEIDPKTADAVGLKISSRLLEVSHIVGSERPRGNLQ